MPKYGSSELEEGCRDPGVRVGVVVKCEDSCGIHQLWTLKLKVVVCDVDSVVVEPLKRMLRLKVEACELEVVKSWDRCL